MLLITGVVTNYRAVLRRRYDTKWEHERYELRCSQLVAAIVVCSECVVCLEVPRKATPLPLLRFGNALALVAFARPRLE